MKSIVDTISNPSGSGVQVHPREAETPLDSGQEPIVASHDSNHGKHTTREADSRSTNATGQSPRGMGNSTPHHKFKATFKSSKEKLAKILPRKGVQMVSVSIKSWPRPGQDRMVHEVKIKPMGLLEELESSPVSFNLMDFGLTSIDNISAPYRFHSSILLWNCQGLGNPDAIDAAKDLCDIHKPDILILTKTRLESNRALEAARRLPFDSSLSTQRVGRSGGILLLWKSEVVQASLVATTKQEIHVTIPVKNSNFLWLLSAIYASPRISKRKLLWENLESIAKAHALPWLALGDFNEVLDDSKKMGGGPVD